MAAEDDLPSETRGERKQGLGVSMYKTDVNVAWAKDIYFLRKKKRGVEGKEKLTKDGRI